MLFLWDCVCQASEEVSKCLVAMKEILYGTNDKEPHTETVAQLAQELYNSGLLISLVENLQVIDFEVSLHYFSYQYSCVNGIIGVVTLARCMYAG